MESQVPASPTAGQRPAATPILSNAYALQSIPADAHGQTEPGKNVLGKDGKRKIFRDAPTQRGVLAVALACLEGGEPFPSRGEIALALQTTPSAIGNAVHSLKKRGALVLKGARVWEVRQ